MKRLTAFVMSVLLIFSFVGCQRDPSSRETAVNESTEISTESVIAVEEDSEVSTGAETMPSSEASAESSTVLVAYFSATGNTEAVAGYLGEELGADLYEIIPEEPYTSEDLNWGNENSRSSQEHEDPSIRPAISGKVENMDKYDVVFLGYPIWWGEAPLIVRTFLESYDFGGKTIIPFCTSASSGLGSSGTTLQAFAPDALWQDGNRFSSRASESEVIAWVESCMENIEFVSHSAAENKITQISITSGETTIYAELDDSETAQEFASMLPLNISMQRVGGGREFYGGMDKSLSYDESDAQTTFENGELGYWFSGNGLCILYDNQVEESEIESGVIVFGRIVSDLSVFHNMQDQIEVTVALAE